MLGKLLKFLRFIEQPAVSAYEMKSSFGTETSKKMSSETVV